MAVGTYNVNLGLIAKMFEERKLERPYIYPLLFPTTLTEDRAGSILYIDDIETIPTEADMIHQDGANIPSDVIDLEEIIGYRTVPYAVAEYLSAKKLLKKGGDQTGTVAGALERKFRKYDRLWESKAKTAIDTSCVEAVDTATATRTLVASAQWSMSTTTAILQDIADAWENFQTQAGVEPNFVWMHPKVRAVVDNAFLLYQDPADFKQAVQGRIDQRGYNLIYGATALTASVSYKSASDTYSKFWDNRFYMAYTETMPNYETATRTYGQMMTYNSDQGEYWTNMVDTEDRGKKVIVGTDKVPKVLFDSCAYKICGPRAGSSPNYTYDLVA